MYMREHLPIFYRYLLAVSLSSCKPVDDVVGIFALPIDDVELDNPLVLLLDNGFPAHHAELFPRGRRPKQDKDQQYTQNNERSNEDDPKL